MAGIDYTEVHDEWIDTVSYTHLSAGNEDWEKSREKASSRLFPYVSLKAHPWIPDDEMPFICCAGVVLSLIHI